MAAHLSSATAAAKVLRMNAGDLPTDSGTYILQSWISESTRKGKRLPLENFQAQQGVQQAQQPLHAAPALDTTTTPDSRALPSPVVATRDESNAPTPARQHRRHDTSTTEGGRESTRASPRTAAPANTPANTPVSASASAASYTPSLTDQETAAAKEAVRRIRLFWSSGKRGRAEVQVDISLTPC